MSKFSIYSNESASGLPWIVFWNVDGRTVRAKQLGRNGTFKTRAEAERAVRAAAS